MDYAVEIVQALEHVPHEIAVIVLTDIDKRISDWLSSGGDKNAPYIQQQVNYARQIGKKYGQKKTLTACKQSQ